jgi:UDP-N-acetyl-D-galactosamine dehydrogenase
MNIVVVGLGYVGLPLAVELSHHYSVCGIDTNRSKINLLRQGVDGNQEVSDAAISMAKILYWSNYEPVHAADVVIVAVPTPVDENNKPDFGPLLAASRAIAPHLKQGAVVCYESTVYPGATRNICLPALEASGKKHMVDFFIGYSPERINPGDKKHGLTNTVKLVAGDTKQTKVTLASMYGSITKVHVCSTIEVAEAAKVLENTQRDVNIALMNEAAMIFNSMGISTQEVLKAASTKWNWVDFKPGLVGGHCIGVDPYYLIDAAHQVKIEPNVISAARKTNEKLHGYVMQRVYKRMQWDSIIHGNPTVTVLGVTFKPDCTDIRNSKVFDIIINELEWAESVQVFDPIADAEVVYDEYGVKMTMWDNLEPADVIFMAVPHAEFRALSHEVLMRLAKPKALFVELNPFFDKEKLATVGYDLWSL